jgi:hypothetical protein
MRSTLESDVYGIVREEPNFGDILLVLIVNNFKIYQFYSLHLVCHRVLVYGTTNNGWCVRS